MQENLNGQIHLKDEELFGTPEQYDYTRFKNLEDYEFDDELMEKFLPVARQLNLSQHSLEMLMDIALEMSRKQNDKYIKNDEDKKIKCMQDYNKMFLEDSELPNPDSIMIKDYMRLADTAYNKFATPKLKEALKETGLIYHPEMIKMFYKIGELSESDNISYDGKPVVEELTPAQILYGPRD